MDSGAGQGSATTVLPTRGRHPCQASRATARVPKATPGPTVDRAQHAHWDPTRPRAARERAPHAEWEPARAPPQPRRRRHAPCATTAASTRTLASRHASSARPEAARGHSGLQTAPSVPQEDGHRQAREHASRASEERTRARQRPPTATHANCAQLGRGPRQAPRPATTAAHARTGAGPCASPRRS